TGRCYEQESLPYKAFDSLIDALSQYLKSLMPSVAQELMTSDILALARLFPVLKQVPAIANASQQVLEIPEAVVLRRRAFAALRALLTNLSRRAPLILAIDDLQWSDLDSCALVS